MRQSVRALAWAVTISMLLLIAFLGTAVYSMVQTAMVDGGIELGEPQASLSDKGLVLSIPLTVNNTSYYDMTELTITTTLKDRGGAVLAENTTTLKRVEKGSRKTIEHRLSINAETVLSNMTHLLFEDTHLCLDSSVGFGYANALGFRISMLTTTMGWGAPLYALNLTGVSSPAFNGTHLTMDIYLEFENHSFTDVEGVLHFKAYNQGGECLGSGQGFLHTPAGFGPSGPVETVIAINQPHRFTGEGYLEVSLETALIDGAVDLGVISYG